MQPLSYQPTNTTCWVTCVLNGLLVLRNGERITPEVYMLLHTLQSCTGVDYWNEAYCSFRKIVDCVENIMGLQIMYYWKRCVATALQELNFKDQIAICDIHSAEHSILLHGKQDRLPKEKAEWWFNCFDSYWCNMEVNANPANFETYPQGHHVNLKVRQEHLLKMGCQKDFRMGNQKSRCLMVIQEKR